MQAVQIHNGFFLVFERGEEFMSALKAFCEQEEVHWAQFTGIGAMQDVEIGYYDLESKEYVFRMEEGPLEVASLTGNVSELNEDAIIHAHAVLSRSDDSLACIGGHLRSAVVALTLEVALLHVTQPLLRGYDDDTGLNLLRL